ncbi:MAG: hypothetical protein ACTHNS_03475 [Marmoricola sp.]
MRRTIITLTVALLVAVGCGAVVIASSGGSAITRARLERSVTTAFSNVYAQQAHLLGHRGVTPASLHAKAMCDKGPGLTQSGPGTSWNCLTSWTDPNVPMPPAGYGKLELNVHSNGCYTVGAPSSLVGYQTITDAAGHTVNNPAYEFDACLDPTSSNTPTGVTFPSALSVTSTTATPDARGHLAVGLACGVGAGGCKGTVTATAGSTVIGTGSFALTEQATTNVPISGIVPNGARNVTYTVHAARGVAPSPATVPVQR